MTTQKSGKYVISNQLPIYSDKMQIRLQGRFDTNVIVDKGFFHAPLNLASSIEAELYQYFFNCSKLHM